MPESPEIEVALLAFKERELLWCSLVEKDARLADCTARITHPEQMARYMVLALEIRRKVRLNRRT